VSQADGSGLAYRAQLSELKASARWASEPIGSAQLSSLVDKYVRHAVPCGKHLTWAKFNTDEQNRLRKRRKSNEVDSPEYREELLQFETYVLPLLACFYTSPLAYEAFYTQNIPRISMLMVRKPAPHVCVFVQHITIDLRMWENVLRRFASRAERAFGFSQLHTVVTHGRVEGWLIQGLGRSFHDWWMLCYF
jgi:hypothetical protein